MGIKISYALTVCNELQEIQVLLNTLFSSVRPQDEIVVLYDSKNGDPKVWQYLNLVSITDDNLLKGFDIHEDEFNGHFADWKNKLNSLCTGDYIFNIDADEIPNKFLLENLPYVLENSEVDLVYVSRVNTVEGLTQDHINKWRWNVSKFESMVEEKEFDLNNPQNLDEYNLLKEYDLIIEETKLPWDKIKVKYYTPIINWCDRQARIYRNSPEIKWEGKVHETIKGFNTYSNLPKLEEWALYHPKTIERQEKQNNYYDSI